MNRLTVLVPLICVMACVDSPSLGPPTTEPPRTPPVIASVRDVMIGERVEGVFGDGMTIKPGEHHFFVTAPNDGTLEVSLQWDPHELGTLLVLKLDGRVFAGSRPDWSPIVGRFPVKAGQRYLIVVALAGADWLPQDPFVLTSRLDQ